LRGMASACAVSGAHGDGAGNGRIRSGTALPPKLRAAIYVGISSGRSAVGPTRRIVGARTVGGSSARAQDHGRGKGGRYSHIPSLHSD
jgi:hypothetical protein